jgi:hypothetical protein
LYTIYQSIKSPKAASYRSYILNNHPNSLYARLVRSQDITEELRRAEQTFEGAYNALYTIYSGKEYYTVIDFSNYILNTFPEKPGFPAVMYLKGLCFGKVGNVDSMRWMYQDLIRVYPESEQAAVAKRTLELLDGAGGKSLPSAGTNAGEERFKDFTKTIAPGDEVVVLIPVKNEKLNINDLKIKISDFNAANFSQDKLSVSGLMYKQYYVSMVQKFNDFRFAWRYVQAVRNDPKIGSLSQNPGKEIIFITRRNLNTCIQKNILEDYLDFFEKYHPEMLAGK